MSTVKTFLTIVFRYEGDMIRATSTFHEEDVRHELNSVGIQWPADRKEVHLSYVIEPPLSPEQLERLTWMKDMGICTSFYLKDEIGYDYDTEREMK